jgi:hypothetical protein
MPCKARKTARMRSSAQCACRRQKVRALQKAHDDIDRVPPETFFHPDFQCSDGKFGGKSAENNWP